MNLTCRTCGGTKPEDAFYVVHANKTGRDYRCKECTRAANREYARMRNRGQRPPTPQCARCGEPTARMVSRYCMKPECRQERQRDEWRRKNRERARRKREGKPRKTCAHCGVDQGYKSGSYCTRDECKSARQRKYRIAHAEQVKATRTRNKAKRRGVKVETVRRDEILERDQWTCGLCSKPIPRTAVYPNPKSPSLDHVVPIADGGEHSNANVQATHLECNVRKGQRGAPQQLALC